ncbi:unnamed protein product [Trifolium pratense]|uniref:Uncharacterized protein n=1 Tax=Trifolium pratense TaxID=57577 RepID=A0ACB0IEV4_TRIPR|nr:unnamed protein product [Trifolium pratense]
MSIVEPEAMCIGDWDERELAIINETAKSTPTRNTINEIFNQLAAIQDLPYQHSKKSLRHKFNKARENFLNQTEHNKLQDEIGTMKQEIANLKAQHADEITILKDEIAAMKGEIAIHITAKEEAQEELVIMRNNYGINKGRKGLKALIKGDIAREKHNSGVILDAIYDKLGEELNQTIDRYLSQP